MKRGLKENARARCTGVWRDVEEYSPMKRGLKGESTGRAPLTALSVEEYSPMKRGLKDATVMALTTLSRR